MVGFLVRAFFLAYRWLHSCCILTRQRKFWFVPFLIRTPIQLWQPRPHTSSEPKHCPKALPLNTNTEGSRISTNELGGGGRNIHPRTLAYWKVKGPSEKGFLFNKNWCMGRNSSFRSSFDHLATKKADTVIILKLSDGRMESLLFWWLILTTELPNPTALLISSLFIKG